MMWEFRDKGDREVCLIPEVTGIFQELWRNGWNREYNTRNVFYVSRCYRYERPQKGRYREFTQVGVEMLGSNDTVRAQEVLRECLSPFDIDATFSSGVRRGMGYYTELGFEVSVESLGAQKQIAGGGAYVEGVGWAIGVDRLCLAQQNFAPIA